MPELKAPLRSKIDSMTIRKLDESGNPLETVTFKPDEKLIIREYPDGRIEKEDITWL